MIKFTLDNSIRHPMPTILCMSLRMYASVHLLNQKLKWTLDGWADVLYILYYTYIYVSNAQKDGLDFYPFHLWTRKTGQSYT